MKALAWGGLRAAVAGLVVWLGMEAAAAARAKPPRVPRIPSAFDLPRAPVAFSFLNAGAQNNDLYAVRGTPDGKRAWAVGAAGTILSVRGERLSLEASGTLADLFDVWVIAPNDVWIVGARGTILHGDGRVWKRVRSGTSQTLYTLWGRGPTDLWAAGMAGTVLHFDGRAWQPVAIPTHAPIPSLAPCGGGDGVCVLALADLLPAIDTSNRPCADPNGDCTADEPAEPEGDRILRWSAGTWSRYPLFGVDARLMLASGADLWLLRDTSFAVVRDAKVVPDGGAYVSEKADSVELAGASTDSAAGTWFVGPRCRPEPPGSGYRCDAGAIWRFDGKRLIARDEAPPAPLTSVWAWSKRGAITVGQRGTIWRFDGERWMALDRPATDADLRAVWVEAPAADGATRAPLRLVTREEKGRRLAELDLGGGRSAWGAPKWPGSPAPTLPDDGTIWLLGDCQAVRAEAGGWESFYPRDCVPDAARCPILATGPAQIWFPSPLSIWDGKTTRLVRSPWSEPPADVWGMGSDVWAVGSSAQIARWDGNALALVAVPELASPDFMTGIWGSAPNDIWAVADAGDKVKLVHWNGVRWTLAQTFGAELPTRYLAATNDGIAKRIWWTSRRSSHWTLWGTGASDVWLAGPWGLVLRFDGSSWSRVPTPTFAPLWGLGGTKGRVVAVGAAGTILQADVRSLR